MNTTPGRWSRLAQRLFGAPQRARQGQELPDDGESLAYQACRRDGSIVHWGATSSRLYGLDAATALGLRLQSLGANAQDREQLRLAIERVFDSNGVETLRRSASGRGGHTLSLVTTLRAQSWRGEQVVVVRDLDVSEEARLVAALHASRGRFDALAQSDSLGFFECDRAGRIQYGSELFHALTETCGGERWTQAVVPEQRQALELRWQEAIGRGAHWQGEASFGSSKLRWLRLHLAPLGDGSGFLGTCEDITSAREAEAALRESEAKFARIFQMMPELVLIATQAQHRILEANDAWERESGWARHEVLGRTLEELLQWPAGAEPLAVAARTGGCTCELTLTCRNQSRMITEATLRSLDFAGEPCLLLLLHNVTENRALQRESQTTRAALQASEAMLSGAFEANPDFISIARLSDGLILQANSAFETLSQWPRGQAIGRSALELGLWADPGDREKLITRLLREGIARDQRVVLRRRDGSQLQCLMHCAQFELNGEPHVLAIVRDLTESLALEAAHQESEAKFSAFFDLAPVPLAVTGPDGRIEALNQGWERSFGWSQQDACGQSFASLTPALLAASELAPLLELLQSTASLDRPTIELTQREGATLTVSLRGRLLKQGERALVLWSAEDVSALRRAQDSVRELNTELEARVEARTRELREALDDLARSEKLAGLGALVAGITHDLNTPIGNSLMAASTLQHRGAEMRVALEAGHLKRSTLDEFVTDTEAHAEVLLRALERARELVASFKQVAADQTSSQRRSFFLHQLVEEVLTVLTPSLRREPVRVEREIDPELRLDSYPGPLGQVLTNFITNALAHAFEGRPQGLITITARARDAESIEFVFSDDGIGIAKDKLEQVFEPFFTTKQGRGGTGLGLHIAAQLVRDTLGGSLTLASTPGSGSRFTMYLPRVAPAARVTSQ